MKKKRKLRDHETDESKIKQRLTLTIWRMQESQTLISVIFYSLTLTGIYIDRVSWRFEQMGIESTALITFILTSFTFVFILFLGYLYDKVFNLWKHKNIVMMKKNIYLSTHLTPKERAHFSEMWLPIVKAIDEMEGKGTLKKTIEVLQRWRETGCVYENSE